MKIGSVILKLLQVIRNNISKGTVQNINFGENKSLESPANIYREQTRIPNWSQLSVSFHKGSWIYSDVGYTHILPLKYGIRYFIEYLGTLYINWNLQLKYEIKHVYIF
jgi:hypothetical protein